MDRKSFLRKSLLALPIIGGGASLASKMIETPKIDAKKQVGFEHIKANGNTHKNYLIHRADSRGLSDHGWLKSHHTFSFANYQNPERVHFGALRVLNDDWVKGGKGFSMHPHQNMEIISIPLSGKLEHQDDMGTLSLIKKGEVQIMSAGKGVYHSEFNASEDDPVEFLQIWVLPQKAEVTPRYGQKFFSEKNRQNKFQLVVSPKHQEALWINQNAYFSLANLDKGKNLEYSLYDKNNLVYLFLIEGNLEILEESLEKRDAIGIWNKSNFVLKATENSEILLMEVPVLT